MMMMMTTTMMMMMTKMSAEFWAMSGGAGRDGTCMGPDRMARAGAEVSMAPLSKGARRQKSGEAENRSRTSPEAQKGWPVQRQRSRKALQDEIG